MVYYLNFASRPEVMTCFPNRIPADQPWYFPAHADRLLEPFQDWISPYYPNVLTVDPGESPFQDWGVCLGMLCVSVQVKEIIEQYEPAIHHFIPVRLHYAQTQHEYFILIFGSNVNCVNVSESRIEEIGASSWMEIHKQPLVVSADAVSNHHLWQTESVPFLRFMSDALHDAFASAKALGGLEVERQLVC